jgi:glutathione S-transferase
MMSSVPYLKNYVGVDCEVQRLDFKHGNQLKPEYAELNPNNEMPTCADEGFVLRESNATLSYVAGKHPEKALAF